MRIPIPLEGVDSIEKPTLLSIRLSLITRLPYIGVFAVPHVRPEIRLQRNQGNGLVQIPKHAAATGDNNRSAFITQLLDNQHAPPFEPHAFDSEPKLGEWQPGERVMFRRPLLMRTIWRAPLSPLLLGGPALAWWSAAQGRPMHPVSVTIVTLVTLAFGLPFLVVFLRSLPRSVVFDWGERTLEIRSAFHGHRIHFDSIKALEVRTRSQSHASMAARPPSRNTAHFA
jgi:hypothetical protein